MKKKKLEKNLIEYEEGAYLFGNYLSIVCQNWILLTMDEKVKDYYGDERYYLVLSPYIYQNNK